MELLWNQKEKKLNMRKNKIKKVIKALNKASKAHAGQAKTLKSVIANKKSNGGSKKRYG